jgi:hypothetical protein
LRSLSEAAMKTPIVNSNAAKSNAGGTVGFIRSRNLFRLEERAYHF